MAWSPVDTDSQAPPRTRLVEGRLQGAPGAFVRFDFALLADFAQVAEGKLYIQGGAFTRVNATSLPWVFPLAIAIRLEPAPDDDLAQEWQLELAITGPDGE